MKLYELFEADSVDPTSGLSSKRQPKQSHKYQRPVGYNYTPGKNALDNFYDDTDDWTDHPIPFKQDKLDDPRN